MVLQLNEDNYRDGYMKDNKRIETKRRVQRAYESMSVLKDELDSLYNGDENKDLDLIAEDDELYEMFMQRLSDASDSFHNAFMLIYDARKEARKKQR